MCIQSTTKFAMSIYKKYITTDCPEPVPVVQIWKIIIIIRSNKKLIKVEKLTISAASNPSVNF